MSREPEYFSVDREELFRDTPPVRVLVTPLWVVCDADGTPLRAEQRIGLDDAALARFLRASIGALLVGRVPIRRVEAREVMSLLSSAIERPGVQITTEIAGTLGTLMAQIADALEGGAA